MRSRFTHKVFNFHFRIQSSHTKYTKICTIQNFPTIWYVILLLLQAFLSVVGKNVDQLEESMSKAEKELDPNKLRKVFSALPGLVSVMISMHGKYQDPLAT